MKIPYLKILLSLLVTAIIIVSCIENHVMPVFNYGSIYVTSDPSGAQIIFNDENTGKVTPDSIIDISAGEYTIMLKLNAFKDTTFSVTVNQNSQTSEDIYLIETNPKAKIVITSNPSGAQIFLNDENTGKITPATFDNLERGNYTIKLKLALYDDAIEQIVVNKDQTVNKNISMAIAGSSGTLNVTSEPSGALISLNGENTGKLTPFTFKPLQPGDYSIELSLLNYRDTLVTTTLNSGGSVTENIKLTLYEPRGSISLSSNPSGAEIFLDDSNTGLFTPAKINKIEAGNYSVKLSLTNYFDTTFSVIVIKDQNTSVPIVNLNEVPFTISLSSNPTIGGNTTGAGGYKNGENVTITAEPNTGYDFVNWTENGNIVSTEKIYSFMADKNRTLVANFILKSYTISATSNITEAGNITGDGTYNHGDEISLNAQANSGYQFVNWTEDGAEVSSDAIYTFTALKDRILIANFVAIGDLEIFSDPQGAQIFLNDVNTGNLTPYRFENLLAGQYSLTLKLNDFADTTINISIMSGQLTNPGVVVLTDIVPDVEVTINYAVNTNGQLIFSFTFNQAIRFEKLQIFNASIAVPDQNYNNQYVPAGRTIDWVYPQKISGDWKFTFTGNKAGGRGAPFTVVKDVNVQ